MRKQRIYINYNKWSDHALATLAGRTVGFMAGNAYFPEPPVAVDAYTALANDYRTKLEVAVRSGSRLEVTDKNNARKALLAAMRQVAFYVNTLSAGNAHKLASSGFVQTPLPEPLQRPYPPLLLKLHDNGRSGELRLTFESVANAWEYEYQLAHDRDSSGEFLWASGIGTTNSRDNLITDLTEGLRYYVRVRSRNGKGLSDWSRTISIIAR